MSLLRLCYKRLRLISLTLSVSGSYLFTLIKQTATLGAALGRDSWDTELAGREPQPTRNWFLPSSSAWAQSRFSQQSLEVTSATPNTLTAVPGDPEAENPAKLQADSWPTEIGDTKHWGSKPLRFRVIGYTAIDDYYTNKRGNQQVKDIKNSNMSRFPWSSRDLAGEKINTT